MSTFLSVLGNFTSESEVQCSKALAPILSRPSNSITFFKFLHR